jgi:hypothetical protein
MDNSLPIDDIIKHFESLRTRVVEIPQCTLRKAEVIALYKRVLINLGAIKAGGYGDLSSVEASGSERMAPVAGDQHNGEETTRNQSRTTLPLTGVDAASNGDPSLAFPQLQLAESARIIQLRDALKAAAASLERNARIRDELKALVEEANADAVEQMLQLNAQLAGKNEWKLSRASQQLTGLLNRNSETRM